MIDDPRPHRPVPRPHLEAMVEAAASAAPFARAELAAATAAAVISQGRSQGAGAYIDLADRVGLETLAELWREEEPSTLPGALWALYLLRRWCHTNGEEVVRLWRAGRAYAPAEEVVAGVADDHLPAAVEALADAVLRGAYEGDFAVALERAAAFFAVIAQGRRSIASTSDESDLQLSRAVRNDELARGLRQAAQSWRRNPL